MTEVVEHWELTSSQSRVLGFIIHSPSPPCSRDIEAAFRLSHPTVSGMLSRLAKKGFVELRSDEEDRRCKRIHVLPKAMALENAIHQAINANEAQLVSGFSPEEQEQFRQLLLRAIHNMGGDPETRKHHKEEES